MTLISRGKGCCKDMDPQLVQRGERGPAKGWSCEVRPEPCELVS